MPRRRPALLRAYLAAVCLLGLGVAAGVFSGPPLSGTRGQSAGFAVLAALVVLGELRPIVVTRGGTRHDVTVSAAFALALALVAPLSLAVAVQTCAVAVRVLASRRPPGRVLFELASCVLTVVAARAVFALLTGTALLTAHPLELPSQLPAALAAGATYFGMSTALGSVARALAVQAPVARSVARDLQAQLATSAVLLSFAPVVAAAVDVTVWLVPLLLAPIAAISKSARLLAEREHEALHDSLTGLPNRALFRLRLQAALEASRAAPTRFGVLLVDLDHFKEINDTLGHQVGDELIAEVARRLSSNLRPGDTVARLGGDEFAVLAVGLTGSADAVALAERLLQVLEDPFVAGDVRLDVQGSLGIAVHPAHGADVDTLLQRADVALYQAKRERGTIRVYEAGADDHTPEKLALAAELRDALQTDQLFLEFQPQIAPVSGRTVGFEALVRWDHPTRGLLMPDDFVPVVENTGLIAPMTMAVLDRALSALAEWRAAGHEVSVAVNLSVRHLTDLDLPRRVEALLRGRDIPPSSLVLEVTETVIMSDPSRAVAVLGLLRDLGIGVAVDDFGTGYSSLAYLRRLQVDELKIDKSFVMDLPRDEGDAVIVRSTIELGHNLGLRVVAEGVEDEATLRMLRGWKCDVVQGYAISKPLPADQVPEWLEARVRELTAFDERWVSAALASAAESGLLELPRPSPPDAAA